MTHEARPGDSGTVDPERPSDNGAAGASAGRRAVVKIDGFVRRHTTPIDVETLHQRGVTKINYLTFSKINELVAIAVAKAFQKYQRDGGRGEAQRIETEARVELKRQLDLYDSAARGTGVAVMPSRGAEPSGDAPAALPEAVRQTIEERVGAVVGALSRAGGAVDAGRLRSALLETVVEVVLCDRRARRGEDGAAAETAAQRADLLERRVERLREHIAQLESALKELEARSGESGIPSIYRHVQGLNCADENYEHKKSLLQVIFEDNAKLQWNLSKGTQSVP